MSGCELVYHIAAAFRQLNVPERYYWDVNVEGTRHLLDVAHQARYDGSCTAAPKVFMATSRTLAGDEQSPIVPEDYYQLTKYEGEKVVQEYVARGLDAVTLRPTAIYGPGDPGALSDLVPIGKTRIVSDVRRRPRHIYHPVYIDNLVDAFELAGRKDRYSRGNLHYRRRALL